MPVGPPLRHKGIALAIADGIGSSPVAHEAAAMAVRGFLEDYYLTSDAWPVRRAAQRVIAATNSWLHAQTLRGDGRFDKDRGFVCTFSALVLKGREAHALHVGDARICRLHPHALEALTEDHRVGVAPGESRLGRALGVDAHVDIDYRHWPLEAGEVYLLATDGVHEFLDAQAVHEALAAHPGDLDAAAAALTDCALARGSADNLTLQLVRVDALPEDDGRLNLDQDAPLALPPILAPRMNLEGFEVVRALHLSPRSHVFLAIDSASGRQVALKTPSQDMRDDPAHLDRLLLEDWVARRIDSPHVLKRFATERPRRSLYTAMDYVEGETLAQWMIDHPRPALDEVRGLVDQVAQGLQAFHRKEMLHRDLRPENVMIDRAGTVLIIDFGAVHVAGIVEGTSQGVAEDIAGSLQYTAPECFIGAAAGPTSDLFALGVVTYQMLAGRLPYGLQVTRLRGPADLRSLRYTALRSLRPDLPAWLDAVLRKALDANPARRPQAVSEFVENLRNPGPEFTSRRSPALVERDPARFWQATTVLLALALVLLVAWVVLRD